MPEQRPGPEQAKGDYNRVEMSAVCVSHGGRKTW